MTAADMKEMQKAKIISIDLKEEDMMRLFYLGIYEGTILQMIQKAPLKDPYIFYVQGSYLILRRQDAKRLEVKLQ